MRRYARHYELLYPLLTATILKPFLPLLQINQQRLTLTAFRSTHITPSTHFITIAITIISVCIDIDRCALLSTCFGLPDEMSRRVATTTSPPTSTATIPCGDRESEVVVVVGCASGLIAWFTLLTTVTTRSSIDAAAVATAGDDLTAVRGLVEVLSCSKARVWREFDNRAQVIDWLIDGLIDESNTFIHE